MQEPLYEKINQQFSDAVQLLLKVQKLQNQDAIVQDPIVPEVSENQKLAKSIIYKDNKPFGIKQINRNTFNAHSTQGFTQNSENDENIKKLQQEATELLMLNSYHFDESRLMYNRLKLNNRIRTEKLQLLLRISQSLDTFIKEQNLTQFQNQNFSKESDANSIQQIKSLQIQINEQLQQLNQFSQDQIIDKMVMKAIESLKAELNERYGQEISELDEKNKFIIQKLREQFQLNKKIQGIFNFKDFYSCNSLSDFYKLHKVIEDKIINRQILNSQVVNGNNIQRIVQHNLNISMEFSVLLNLIMYNFTLVIVKQILNKLERREQIQNVQQISEDLIKKLMSFEAPEEILIYLDKLASIREDEKRLGSNFVYHAIKIQDYRVLEELVQCSYTQDQLRQTIMQQINNFASVDQFTEQIYHLMKNNQEVNECDLDLLQAVLLEDNELYYNQLVDNNAEQYDQRHIAMDKQLANTLARQSQMVASGQIIKNTYRSSKMFLAQPQKQTELSQMLQYIQIYNYRQSEQFVDKSNISLKRIQEQLSLLEQKQQQQYQTIQDLQAWYEGDQQVSVFLKQIKTIMGDMSKFYKFIQYQIFIDHVDNSYDKIIHYTNKHEEEQNDKLKDILNQIEISQESWHCKHSTDIKLKKEIKDMSDEMMNELNKKLHNVIQLTGQLNQLEKYKLDTTVVQHTPQNNLGNMGRQQLTTLPIDLDLGVDELHNYTQNMQKQVHSQLVSEIELFNKLQQQFQEEEEQKLKYKEASIKNKFQESIKEFMVNQKTVSSQDSAMIKAIAEETGI